MNDAEADVFHSDLPDCFKSTPWIQKPCPTIGQLLNVLSNRNVAEGIEELLSDGGRVVKGHGTLIIEGDEGEPKAHVLWEISDDNRFSMYLTKEWSGFLWGFRCGPTGIRWLCDLLDSYDDANGKFNLSVLPENDGDSNE